MFVRFRSTARSLQASLIVTRRFEGKVHHEHVAGLGTVPVAPSPADRIAFWTKLHQRLDALSNRVDAAQCVDILAAIHARIPMPTMDEHQAVQIEYAKVDAALWQQIADTAAADIEGHKQLLATTEGAMAERQKVSADFSRYAQEAKDRLARVENGETAAVPAPLTRKDMLRISGMTEAEAQHCMRLAYVADQVGLQVVLDEQARHQKREEKAVVRRLYRQLRGG
jgi:hypothetical protein